jgi:3-keto-disaccharide hydrolase
LEIWFQPTGGNVRKLTDFKADGSHLTLNISKATPKEPATAWDLDAAGGKLTGAQHHGAESIALTGVRAPALQRNPPSAWTDPEPLFNGKDLSGWEPTDPAHNNWVVENGELLNKTHGANLRGTRKFDDFKLHIEFNCPDDGNSGVYLRGRYETQLEYEALDKNPPERRIGSIYGFLAPAVAVPRKPGTWESFDITLVGRNVTVIHDGTLTIDHKEIPGITGGALDANEGDPGPIYIQGDHTGGLRFRNIRISVPRP